MACRGRMCTSLMRKIVGVCPRADPGQLFFLFGAVIVTSCVAMVMLGTFKAPTVVTVLEDMTFNFDELQKESLNTVLLEQDNGEAYIAFRLKHSARLLRAIQGNRVTTNEDLKHSQSRDREPGLATSPISTQPVIYPAAFPYILNSKNVCSKEKNLTFIVIVHTAVNHFMRRSSIRETWANYKVYRDHTMRIVFLIGKTNNENTQLLIEHEYRLYRDIVQGDFMDSYRNLTHKGVLGYRWISEHCPHAKFIVKVDDDVFVNVFKLLQRMETDLSNKSRHIWCAVRPKGTSLIQRKKGKWKIDENEFRNMTHYPVTYCNGFFVVMTSDMVRDLYEASKAVPFFWVDDVYLYGLLPNKTGNVKHLPLMNLNLNQTAAKVCFENTTKPCHMLVANAHSDGMMDQLWFRALDQYKTLAQKYSKDALFVKVR